MKSLQIIRKIVFENTFFVIMAVLSMMLAGFFEAGSIVSLTPIIDLLINQDLTTTSKTTTKILTWFEYLGIQISFLSISIFFLTVIVIKNSVKILSKFIVEKIYLHLVKNIILDEFISFLSSRWQFFVTKDYGVLGNTLLTETEKIGHSFETAANILSNLLKIIFCILMCLMISWQLTLIVMTLTMISLIPVVLLGRTTYKVGKMHLSAFNEFQGTIIETFNGLKLIFGFGNQEKSINKVDRIISKRVKAAIRFVMIRAIAPLVHEPIGILIIVFAVYLATRYYMIAVSELIVILYLLKEMVSYAITIANQRNYIQNLAPALEQIYRLKDEADSMVQPTGSQEIKNLKYDIVLKNVSFSYPNHDEALNDINIVIPRGKMIAFTGNSGSGKTTLVDILMGFYEVDKGEHLIDGVPFNKIDIRSWRKKIGYVPQEIFLFNSSIKDNLLWGTDHATDGEIYKACALSNAVEFIEKLPKMYNTIVGESGVRLSGGQRQRIALARAILRNPELIVLDEATSSLDSHSELLIQKAIEKISKQTTIIIIAHRLSTIKKSDYIYVFHNGTIIEEGNFNDLISKNNRFMKIAKLQGIN